ncbi:DNA methyltransferase [Rhizobium phaseoli]|uniref:DNA methyltransferase n=1 Tax=Rhizobium phaseoli TaxID=396 RepID=UPI001AED077B|nr:DNA methyltransferase [Rhizobium phaseoli]
MNDLFKADAEVTPGPVECLGITFESDAARREHFIRLLSEKLRDPEFRQMEGFPHGSDDDILKFSDPPYYTACPNPFFSDFMTHYGKNWTPDDVYDRKPFVADVSAAKTDHLYKSHRYHTKVPYKAIAQYLLHFTRPGDIVLDAFCGTGMTGIAADYLATPELEILRAAKANSDDEVPAEPGPRHALLADLSPAASQLAAGFNTPVDVRRFLAWARSILKAAEKEFGWTFECTHEHASVKGTVTEYVWSEIFSCPECSGGIDFLADCCDE